MLHFCFDHCKMPFQQFGQCAFAAPMIFSHPFPQEVLSHFFEKLFVDYLVKLARERFPSVELGNPPFAQKWPPILASLASEVLSPQLPSGPHLLTRNTPTARWFLDKFSLGLLPLALNFEFNGSPLFFHFTSLIGLLLIQRLPPSPHFDITRRNSKGEHYLEHLLATPWAPLSSIVEVALRNTQWLEDPEYLTKVILAATKATDITIRSLTQLYNYCTLISPRRHVEDLLTSFASNCTDSVHFSQLLMIAYANPVLPFPDLVRQLVKVALTAANARTALALIYPTMFKPWDKIVIPLLQGEPVDTEGNSILHLARTPGAVRAINTRFPGNTPFRPPPLLNNAGDTPLHVWASEIHKASKLTDMIMEDLKSSAKSILVQNSQGQTPVEVMANYSISIEALIRRLTNRIPHSRLRVEHRRQAKQIEAILNAMHIAVAAMRAPDSSPHQENQFDN